MKTALVNKTAWTFTIVHWIAFTIAIYQRGGLSGNFHFFYEPVLFKILIVLDFAWFWISDVIHLGSLQDPSRALAFVGIFAGIQWYLVGYGVSLLRKRGIHS